MSEPITPEELRAKAARLRRYRLDGGAAADLFEDAAAEIERLQALVDAAPVREERAGECFCGKARVVFKQFGDCWEVDGYDVSDYGDTWKLDADVHCWDCGAHLGADGVARRWKERAMGREHAAEAFGGEVEAE